MLEFRIGRFRIEKCSDFELEGFGLENARISNWKVSDWKICFSFYMGLIHKLFQFWIINLLMKLVNRERFKILFAYSVNLWNCCPSINYLKNLNLKCYASCLWADIVCLNACFEFAPKSLLWLSLWLDILLYCVCKLENCNVIWCQ